MFVYIRWSHQAKFRLFEFDLRVAQWTDVERRILDHFFKQKNNIDRIFGSNALTQEPFEPLTWISQGDMIVLHRQYIEPHRLQRASQPPPVHSATGIPQRDLRLATADEIESKVALWNPRNETWVMRKKST